jgi:acyl carrier protein
MSATRETIEAEVREFLVQAMPHLADKLARLPASARLWDVAESLQVLDLLEYLERRFEFALNPIDFTPENIGTIGRLTELVFTRQQQLRAT